MSKHICSDHISVSSQYSKVLLQQDMFGNTQAKKMSEEVITQIDAICFVDVMELVSKWGRASARISSTGSDFEVNGLIPGGDAKKLNIV